MNVVTLAKPPAEISAGDFLTSIRSNTINPLVSASATTISAINTLNDIKLDKNGGIASTIGVSGILSASGGIKFSDGTTISSLVDISDWSLSEGSAITLTPVSSTGYTIISVSADELTIKTSVGNRLSIGAQSISSAHIANNAVDGAKLTDNTITFSKLNCYSTTPISLSSVGSDLIIPTQKAVQTRTNSDFTTMLMLRNNAFSEVWTAGDAIEPTTNISSRTDVNTYSYTNGNAGVILYPNGNSIIIERDGWDGMGLFTTYIYALSAEAVAYYIPEVNGTVSIWHNLNRKTFSHGNNTLITGSGLNISVPITYVPGLNRVDFRLDSQDSQGSLRRLQILGKWIDKVNLF